jgi:hypothetical protein
MLFELIHLKGIMLPITLINEIRRPVHRGTIKYTQLLKFDNSSCSLTWHCMFNWVSNGLGRIYKVYIFHKLAASIGVFPAHVEALY